MSSAAPSPTRIVFLGLDTSLGFELRRSIPGHEVLVLKRIPANLRSFTRYLERHRPDVLFCPTELSVRSAVLTAAQKLLIPVIVVSRLPYAHDWLDAIESGAADYIAPPFEPRQMEWVMAASRRAMAVGA